jgi:hypothetical protein
MSKIQIEINGIKYEFTIDEAKKLKKELDRIFNDIDNKKLEELFNQFWKDIKRDRDIPRPTYVPIVYPSSHPYSPKYHDNELYC